MYPKFLIVVLLLGLTLPVSAQVYGGQNTLQLSGAGSQQETAIECPQLVTNYVFDQQIISMMIKTDAMAFDQSPASQRILEEVFLTSSNKIFLVQLNVSDLGLQSGTSARFDAVSVPLLIRYNNIIYRGTATADLSFGPEKVSVDFQAQVPLSELGLSLAGHQSDFSDTFTLAVEEGSLDFKY